MGNIADKICENKYEFAMGSLALALGAFCLYHRYDNDELRRIANSIDPYISLAQSHNIQDIHQNIDEKVIVNELVKYKEYPIYRIAITGGPCAGKSTALNKINKHFTEAGFHVMIVPEIPTLISEGGGFKDFATYKSQQLVYFQLQMMRLKIYLQDYIAKLGQMAKQPTIILCDRGLVDCAAYMSHDNYQAILDESGWTWSHLRDKRYDSVIFMNTAAKGAEEFYTLENNAARTETPEQARRLDDRTLAAWIGHPYMTVVPNIRGKPFSYKVNLAISAVQKTIGLESTRIQYHKYLVQIDQYPQRVKIIESEIEEIFLKNQNPRYIMDRIRKRGQDESYTYQRRYMGKYHPTSQFRESRKISLNSLQYATLAQNEADPYFRPVHLKRKNFEWNSYYFNIDSFDYIKDHKQALLLRFQLDRELDPLEIIPPWIRVIRNVRDEKEFNMGTIAYRDY